ncbi:UTP--glucose-1-phosphate uridylyltransferase [Thermodesulfobacterium sp. TA1]|uniref:UTP--glucose-1-phosphate uridylyltransferase n=1 Tax=Thermodesulfobacterium sp. TA1 TaxID=2234087 RepID=UPI00123248E9|nr:UTP--glucose-1-phosphate uridylyltransferase [Thermodesulfobacterium sp. TA1]QER42181.1 UTP--glucose-1-phosphate uridylyltransferase [Thermodesulfobacterium sp. TA1]
MKVRKAVLPVAGLGTRMLPITKVVPKELLPVIERPTVEYVIDEAIQSGVNTLIFIISQGKGKIIDYFDIDLNLRSFLKERGKTDLLEKVKEVEEKIKYLIEVRQKVPEGLGHAILMAEEAVGKEPFAVLLGDDLVDADPPCLKQMLEVYQSLSLKVSRVSLIAVEEVSWEHISRYGIIDGEKVEENLIRIKNVVEKPAPEEAPSNLAIIGRYIFDPVIFDYLKRIPKVNGEYQLTDAIQLMVDEGHEVYAYLSKGIRFDTGNREGFFKTILHYACKDPKLEDVLKSFCQKRFQI